MGLCVYELHASVIRPSVISPHQTETEMVLPLLKVV